MEESIKRVTLPAAVFNRTPNKERRQGTHSNNKLFAVVTPNRHSVSPSMNSSRRQRGEEKENSRVENQKIEGDVCMNHQFKEASYSVVGECGKYCEKCAIFLASQGFKVKRMASQSHSLHPQLKHQIDTVNTSINQTLRILGTKTVQTTQCQTHCHQTFQQQLSIAQHYFQQLHKLIDYYQQQTLHYIQNQFNQSQSIQEQLKLILSDSLNETTSIKSLLNSREFLSSEDDEVGNTLQLWKMRLNSYKKMARYWKAEDIVMRGMSLCDVNHVKKVLDELYEKEGGLFGEVGDCGGRSGRWEKERERGRMEMEEEDGVIEEEETITQEDDS